MSSLNYPNIITDKIAWYQWKDRLKEVHQHFAFHPEEEVNIYVITSQTELTEAQAICGLIKAKGDIGKFADSTFPGNDHIKILLKCLSDCPECI